MALNFTALPLSEADLLGAFVALIQDQGHRNASNLAELQKEYAAGWRRITRP